MDMASLIGAFTALAALSGIWLGWIGRNRTVRQDTVATAERDARLHAAVASIKHGVDELRVEQRLQGQRFDALTERITRVEESTKQAHKRIDRMEAE